MNRLRPLSLMLVICMWLVTGDGATGISEALTLSFRDGTLSIRSQQEPLGAVLTELARQTGLQVHVTQVQAAKAVSVSFDNLPLEEGIQRLLRGLNYALLLAPPLAGEPPRPTSNIAEIRVLDTGQFSAPQHDGRAQPEAAPQAEQAAGSDQPLAALIQQAYSAAEPLDRMRALGQLWHRMAESERVLPALLDALHDEHDDVRKEALGFVSQSGDETAIEAIGEVALTDASPRLRLSALRLLAEIDSPIAHHTLEQALEDPDPRIQIQAGVLLEGRSGNP